MNTANKAQALTAPASVTRLARKENARGDSTRKRLAGAGTTCFSLMDAMRRGLVGDSPLSLQGKAPQP